MVYVLFLFSRACSGSIGVLIWVCGNCCTVVLAAHIDHSSARGVFGLAIKEICDCLRRRCERASECGLRLELGECWW
jgi:hypothetical protein